MQPLATSQQVMTWLCMCPAEESTSKKRRLCYVAFSIIVSIITFAALLTSIVFFIKYLSIDFEAALYTIFQIAAESAVLNLIIVALINRQRIAAIFTELTKLYASSKNRG